VLLYSVSAVGLCFMSPSLFSRRIGMEKSMQHYAYVLGLESIGINLTDIYRFPLAVADSAEKGKNAAIGYP